jgi:spore germination cell wall hydrolase CwlJ-like protein
MRAVKNFISGTLNLVLIVAMSLTGWQYAIAMEANLLSEEAFKQEICMAKNIYHEARSDNVAGMYAVADVVLNRVNDGRYPDTVCDVVYQGPVRESWKTRKDETLSEEDRVYYPVRNMCQFSWYCDGKKDDTNDETAWALAQEIAYKIMNDNKYKGITEGATHYHATYVNPEWAQDLNLVGRIGSHIFYRWD